MSLLEVVIAFGILIVTVGGLVGTLLSSQNLGRSSVERQLAIQAAGNWIERLQGEDFSTVYVTYNDWTFDVTGLRTQDGQPAVGSIEFPTLGAQLREDVDDAQLGMPRDLNADGAIDGASRADDYLLLPVRVNVAWNGSAGNAQVSLSTFLFDIGS